MSQEQNGKSTPRREFIEASHISVVIGGVILAVGGWSTLVWLVNNTLPTVPNRWAFFALLQVALTGTALPFVRFLHQRFSKDRALFVNPNVMVRQAVWVGLFGSICAWLRIPRLLSIPIAVVVALALVAIELLLRIRERTQWRPE